MTDEYRSLSLSTLSLDSAGGKGSRLIPFGEPLRTLAVGHELDADTFALWRLNETEYQDVNVVNTAQSATAEYNTRSLLFGGTNEYVTMGDVLDFDYTDQFSISFWFKATSNGQYLVSKMDNSASLRGYGVVITTTTGRIGFYRINNSSTNYAGIYTNTAFNDGVWHHVAVTTDGAGASGMVIYVDGSAQATTTQADTLSATILNNKSLNLSGIDDGAANLYVGYLSEVVIHNVELSSSQVTGLYNGGVPADPRTLSPSTSIVGYWRGGNGDTYPTITDLSSGGNDGTMVNMETTDITREVPVGYMLAPVTPSSWTHVPPITYGPAGKQQPARWFLGGSGTGATSNFTRSGNSILTTLFKSTAFTVEAWIYVENLSAISGTTHATVFIYGGDDSGAETEAQNWLFSVRVTSGGNIYLFWEYGTGTNVTFTTSSSYISNRTWYHLGVVCTETGGTRTAKIYVDGVFKEQTTGTNATGGTNAAIWIGTYYNTNGGGYLGKFPGAICEVCVSDSDRSSEMASRAASYQHSLDSNTVALWRFNDPPAISDEAGNVPLNSLSFTSEPVITTPLINDNGRARLFNDTRDAWFPTRTLLRDFFLSGDITFEAWFRVNDKDGTSGSFSPNNMSIIAFAGDWTSETEANNVLFRILFDTSSQRKLVAYWEYSTGTNVVLTSTNEVLTTAEWWTRHHIALTREVGATTTVRMYWDGEFVQEFTGQTNPSGGTDVGAQLTVGYNAGVADTPFVLDDVRLSSKIRTAGEIAQSYARGTPVDRITRYRKRARDSGSVDVVYVTWETTDPDGTYQGIIPGGGPLVDEVILDEYQV